MLKIKNFQPASLNVIDIPNIKYDIVLNIPWLRSINPLIDWSTLVVASRKPLDQSILLNPKLEDLINTTPLDLTDLDRKYLTEGDNKLKDHDEYIRWSLEGTIQLCATGVTSLNTKTTELPPKYQVYANVFDSNRSKRLPPLREGNKHSINLVPDAKLPRRRYYNYSDLELKVMRKWLTEELEYNKIRPSKLPCVSAVLMAKKPHAGPENLRPYINYWQLNTGTIKNRYPLPLFEIILKRIRGVKKYVKLDI